VVQVMTIFQRKLTVVRMSDQHVSWTVFLALLWDLPRDTAVRHRRNLSFILLSYGVLMCYRGHVTLDYSLDISVVLMLMLSCNCCLVCYLDVAVMLLLLLLLYMYFVLCVCVCAPPG